MKRYGQESVKTVPKEGREAIVIFIRIKVQHKSNSK